MNYKFIKNIAGVFLGNTIYALAVLLFIVPNGLITGGSTGLSIGAYHLFGIPMTLFLSVFNLLMFNYNKLCNTSINFSVAFEKT